MTLADDAFSKISDAALITELIKDCFDEIVLIDTDTSCVMNVSDRLKEHNVKKNAGMSYDTQVIKTLTDKFSEPERSALVNALVLPHIKKELETKEQYSVNFSTTLQSENTALCKELTFKYFDSSKSVIMMVCRDISEIVLSERDTLTGIYNSSGFHKRAARWISENPGRKFRIQRYNIDRFRDINGIYGYDVGNKLLRDIANYMRRFNTADSFSAHLNVDHFARFCADDAMSVEECYDSFKDCFKSYDLHMPIKVHMGVYDLCETDCDTYTMSYKALIALQSIKGNLTRKIAYYEKGMMAVEKEQQELLSDIQTAIDDEQFEVWFQPQFDFSKGSITGAEALIRWNHPKMGMISPAVFIPLLEKSDYISRVDKYVIEKTCGYIKKWCTEFPDRGIIPVSVNLSRVDIYQNDLCAKLSDILKKYGVPTNALHLEITESAYMDNTAVFLNTISALRNNGFIVEMDDFGSGYSSLNLLKDINIDKLKLDMKFLSETSETEKSKIIISSIINMARELKVPVIAEGVETKEQAEMLMGFGCNQMQGYYFSRPVPEAEYENMLCRQNLLA